LRRHARPKSADERFGERIPDNRFRSIEGPSRLRKKIDNAAQRHASQSVFHKRSERLAKSQKREERVRTIVRAARLAERTAPLIVPNRPDERPATHGPTHGGIRARRRNVETIGTFNAERERRGRYLQGVLLVRAVVTEYYSVIVNYFK